MLRNLLKKLGNTTVQVFPRQRKRVIMVLLQVLLLTLGLSFASASADKKYVAEGYIVLEDSVMDLYRPYDPVNAEANLREDLEYFFTFSNQLYATMQQYGLYIELRFLKVEILNENILVPNKSTGRIGDGDVLHQFGNWIEKTNAKETLKFDFAVLYTGNPLGDFNGIAWTGVMCVEDKNPLAVIRFGGQGTAVTQAHEIAHIFGGMHNGKEGHHVMRSKRSYTHMERFTFAECTYVDISRFLEKSGDQCLLETRPESWTPNMPPEKYNGRLFDLDNLCRQVYGPESFGCNIRYSNPDLPDEHVKCVAVHCVEPGAQTMSCLRIQTPEGMPCDHNKVCRLGKCVPDSSSTFAQAIKPGCMFGDQEKVYYAKKWYDSCDQAFDVLGPILCKDESAPQFECCDFCAKKKKEATVSGCIGDYYTVSVDGESMSCAAAIAEVGSPTICKNSYGFKRCCQTCNALQVTEDCFGDENDVKFTGVGLLSCASAIARAGKNTICNNDYGNRKCCKTCHDLKTDIPGCFGDEETVNVSDYGDISCGAAVDEVGMTTLCKSDYGRSRCCETCNSL